MSAAENRANVTPAPTPYRRGAGAGRRALVAAEPGPGERAQVAPAGKVLTHPDFDRPAVVNLRRPGPKKGTVSLAIVRRQRVAQAAVAQAAEARRMAIHSAPSHDVLRELAEAPTEQATIEAALSILDARLRRPGACMTSPWHVREFLTLRMAARESEGFGVLFLDSQHTLIEFAVMFEGTLSETAVYPREVVKRALRLNAAAVVLAHNHPSGCPEPSPGDERMTQALKAALALVDVTVLDHVVIGRLSAVSMAERGMV